MLKSNAVITINRTALKNNIEVLSALQDHKKGIIAVVKADAYGHGSTEVARTLDPLVDAFAVNDVHEAIELRDCGIDRPILVFEPPRASLASVYLTYELTATVSSTNHFEILSNGTSYHLNFDTGMKRFGFDPYQAKQIADLIEKYDNLTCTGIYTHFATADEPDSTQVMEQYKQFKAIRRFFPDNIKAHVSNTGGAAFYSFNQYDMVRYGIGMYGYSPGETVIEGLKPVLSWRTRLAAVKRIKAGDSVSYGANWKADADGFLGVLPVGYEDGLKRELSGQFSVQIESNIYEVAGTITMNYCMIYMGVNNYPVGTEVHLLNPPGDAHKWAHKTKTISYEILTGINSNIPREYIS